MEQRDLLYIIFWSLAMSIAAYFLGFGEKSVFLFALALVGTAMAEKLERTTYAVGAVFLALAFAAYFGKSSAYFLGQVFAASLLFLLVPFLLLELRKLIGKKK